MRHKRAVEKAQQSESSSHVWREMLNESTTLRVVVSVAPPWLGHSPQLPTARAMGCILSLLRS